MKENTTSISSLKKIAHYLTKYWRLVNEYKIKFQNISNMI